MEKARWTLESKLNRNGVLPKVGDNIYLIKPSGEIEKLDFQKNIKNITSIKGNKRLYEKSKLFCG